jgi:hypothetical protein
VRTHDGPIFRAHAPERFDDLRVKTRRISSEESNFQCTHESLPFVAIPPTWITDRTDSAGAPAGIDVARRSLESPVVTSL